MTASDALPAVCRFLALLLERHRRITSAMQSACDMGSVEWTGCDAASVHLITSMMAGTLSLGDGPLVVTGTLAIMIPWFAAQWEEYHTGVML